MRYIRPNQVCYRLAQVVCWFVAAFIFKRKIIRNEIKGKEGPFVIIANHQAAYDFVNLIGLNRRPMSFVISSSFYHALPIRGFLDKLGVIPKQQFQTSVRDMKRMKAVIEQGQPLVIYPAGLMCEDGLSTPIPAATYKFLKWLKADVYMARTQGTYFAMPKWGKGLRPGRTYMDVYKLFDKEELAGMDVEEVRARTDEALLFDAYREQERLRVSYKGNSSLEGLEHVLYMCPHCLTEFSIKVKNGNTLSCSHCGFEQISDEYALLHNRKGVGREVRYVSDWSRFIYGKLREKVERGVEDGMSVRTGIHMIPEGGKRFTQVGEGVLSLSRNGIRIDGQLHGERAALEVPIGNIPTLPFSPGKYLEVQQGDTIYRCVLEDGRLTMKFINLVKIFYELNCAGDQMVSCG